MKRPLADLLPIAVVGCGNASLDQTTDQLIGVGLTVACRPRSRCG